MSHPIFKAKVIRTIRPIPSDWFHSDGYLPVNMYLGFTEKDYDRV